MPIYSLGHKKSSKGAKVNSTTKTKMRANDNKLKTYHAQGLMGEFYVVDIESARQP